MALTIKSNRARRSGFLAGTLTAVFAIALQPLMLPNIAQAIADAVIINEVMPNPVQIDDAQGEWIELKNNSDVDVDISGWKIDTATISPGKVVAANDLFVLCRSVEATDQCDDVQSFVLTNTGETLQLLNASDEVQDEFTYSSSNAGESLEVVKENGTSTGSSNSVDGYLTNETTPQSGNTGTPGATNRATPTATAVTNARTGMAYGTLQDAVDGAQTGDTLHVNENMTINSRVNITTPMVIDGAGHVLSPDFTGPGTSNSNNATLAVLADDVTIKNLTIDGTGGTALNGIVAYEVIGAMIQNVMTTNNDKFGIVVNGSTVHVDTITTSGNTWGGIDVDLGSGVTQPASLTVTGTSTHTEAGAAIYIDDDTKAATVNAPDYTWYRSGLPGRDNDRVYQLKSTMTPLPTTPGIVGNVIFDALPQPLPGNVPSLGYQATKTSALGDKITFAGTNRSLTDVQVDLSSWACETGSWNGGNCATTPGAAFTHPLTLTIYNVANDGGIGSVIAAKTQLFSIPYRPTVSPYCTDGKWMDVTGTCNNGFNHVVTFDMSGVVVPDTIIYSVAYNTGSYGSTPIGSTGPYDSLNVGLNDIDVVPKVGIDVDSDVLWWDTTYPGYTAGLKPDTGWGGYMVAAKFAAVAVDTTPPPAPTITAPGARTWHKASPILNKWTAVIDASGIDYYQIAYNYDDGHSFGGSTCPGVTISGYSGFIGCRNLSDTQRNHTPNLSEEGGVTIWVRAVDNAGNVGAWSSPVHYYYDHTAPTTDIDVPTGTVGRTFTVSGEVSDNLQLNRVYVQLVNRDDGRRYGGTTINLIPDGSSASWSRQYNVATDSMPDGTYAAHVTVVDMAGNSSSVGWTDNFVVDGTAPAVAGVVVNGQSVDAANVRYANCDDPTMFYTIAGELDLTAILTDTNGIANSRYKVRKVNTSGCTVSGVFSSSYHSMANVSGDGWNDAVGFDTTTVPDGDYTIMLVTTDPHGNSITSYIDIRVDNTAPIITITQPDKDTLLVPGPIMVQGTIDDLSVATVTVELNGETQSAPVQNNGTWQTMFSNVPAGIFNVTATATDAAGNTYDSSMDVTVTNIPPQIGNGPPAPAGNRGAPENQGGEVLGVSTDGSNGNTLTPFTGLLPAAALFAQAGIGSEGESVGLNSPESNDDEDIEVLGEDNEQSTEGTLEDDVVVEDGCASLFGLCWYWWVPIGLAGFAVVYVLVRAASEDDELPPASKR